MTLPLCNLEIQHQLQLVGPGVVVWGQELRRGRAWVTHSVGCRDIHCLTWAPTVRWLTSATTPFKGYLLSLQWNEKRQETWTWLVPPLPSTTRMPAHGHRTREVIKTAPANADTSLPLLWVRRTQDREVQRHSASNGFLDPRKWEFTKTSECS